MIFIVYVGRLKCFGVTSRDIITNTLVSLRSKYIYPDLDFNNNETAKEDLP